MEEAKLKITCFCAAWCRTCDAYSDVVREIQESYGSRIHFEWLDIEEHSDLLDDIDIENFPTLLIANESTAYFFGPVLPYAAAAKQLIDKAFSQDLPALTQTEVVALRERLMAR